MEGRRKAGTKDCPKSFNLGDVERWAYLEGCRQTEANTGGVDDLLDDVGTNETRSQLAGCGLNGNVLRGEQNFLPSLICGTFHPVPVGDAAVLLLGAKEGLAGFGPNTLAAL